MKQHNQLGAVQAILLIATAVVHTAGEMVRDQTGSLYAAHTLQPTATYLRQASVHKSQPEHSAHLRQVHEQITCCIEESGGKDYMKRTGQRLVHEVVCIVHLCLLI